MLLFSLESRTQCSDAYGSAMFLMKTLSKNFHMSMDELLRGIKLIFNTQVDLIAHEEPVEETTE